MVWLINQGSYRCGLGGEGWELARLGQFCSFAFLPPLLSTEPSRLFSFRFRGSCPLVLPSGFNSFLDDVGRSSGFPILWLLGLRLCKLK